MDTQSELEAALRHIAERSAIIRPACTNEESTKLYLVLPVVSALGYDHTDPFVVQPEYAADFRSDDQERVDYVVIRDGTPAIAIECKKVGTDLTEDRGQLRTYFSALPSVRLGILSNGLRFEFFVDSEAPNIMDEEPFVTLDMERAAHEGIPADVLEALSLLTHRNFHPETIAEAAAERLIAKRLRTTLMQEVREPSEDLCRVLLQRVGLKNIRRSSIQARYSSLVRAAFEDALVIPVMEKLRIAYPAKLVEPAQADDASAQRIITTERELAVFRYVCRRLAYLATDESQFSAVERVQYRDYVGKFAVYYEKPQKGRLFDFLEGANGYDKFIFPEPFGEIVTNAMRDIDEPLRAIFALRIRELGAPARTAEVRVLQTA